MIRNSVAFPEAQQKRVTDAMHDYVHAVVDRQWPLMRQGTPDPDVTNRQLVALDRAFQDFEPTTEPEKAYYAQSIADLDEVAGQRRQRLSMAESELPVLMKILVFGGALVMIPLKEGVLAQFWRRESKWRSRQVNSFPS